MQKDYRVQVKLDNVAGRVLFFGNVNEVNEVLANLWIDKNSDDNRTLNITIDDGINLPITNVTSTEFFKIHGNISIKAEVSDMQTQFNSQIPHPNPTKDMKFFIQSIFQPADGDKDTDLTYNF